MPSPGRFSIDVDIITQVEREEIENVLTDICNGNPFVTFKLNEQRSYKVGIPKAHYALFYRSGLTGKEDHILLDILFDTHSYPFILEKPVFTEWIRD